MSETITFNLGVDAVLYLGSSTTEDSSTGHLIGTGAIELKAVTDVNISMTRESINTNTRANKGWTSSAAGLRDCSITFDILDNSDASSAITLLQTAFLGSGSTALLFCAAMNKATSGSGPIGVYTVTNFSRNEALNDSVKYSVELKLYKFDQWGTFTPSSSSDGTTT